MRPEFRTLRVKQLERALESFDAAKNSPRPQKGWLRVVREATGISLREMATRLKKTPTLAAKLEKSEAVSDYLSEPSRCGVRSGMSACLCSCAQERKHSRPGGTRRENQGSRKCAKIPISADFVSHLSRSFALDQWGALSTLFCFWCGGSRGLAH